jgi:hypothetical protein
MIEPHRWDPQERPRFTGVVYRYLPHYATVKDAQKAAVDGTHAQEAGGRWNPPRSYEVLYTSCTENVAIANLRHKYRGRSFQLSDLAEEDEPDLYDLEVDQERLVNAVSDSGLEGLGLPPTYPNGIGHDVTQPIGARLHAERYAGVWCRSAADRTGQEIALFLDNSKKPKLVRAPRRLAEWFPDKVD